ncbi:MAG TPA: glycosyltransferase family 39 protein [Acidobacteriota bacterium]|nr:glycosyltransferase family 39 protein [Acidobacteriota bacterium]
MPRSRQMLLAAAFTLLVVYLTLFFQLGDVAFMGADEPRYARIAQEMQQSGDWVTPRLEGRPWLEKPPLFYWLAASSYFVWGVSEAAARLPNVLLGVVTALAVAFMGAFIGSPRAGLFSLLILITSPLYVGLSRSASTDAPLTAALSLACIWAFMAGEDESSHRRRLLWSALAGFGLGAAVLAKGPVALVLFGGIFLVYFLWLERVPWSPLQMAAGGGVFLLTAVPWYYWVWQANGYDFVITFWINHHIARFVSDIHHHGEPIWYYVVVLLFGFFPWFFYLGPAAVGLWKRLRQRGHSDVLEEQEGQPDRSVRGEVFVWIWALIPFLFFSTAKSKLGGYILPILPALALIVGLLWDRHVDLEISLYRRLKRSTRALSAFALVLMGALPIASHVFYDSAALGFWLALPLAAGMAVLWLRTGQASPGPAFLTLVAMMTLFISTAYFKGGPSIEDYHSTRDVVTWVRPELSEQRPLVFYRFFHHSARYYAHYQARSQAIHSYDELLDFLSQASWERYLVLTKEEGRRDLETYFHSRLLSRQGEFYLLEVRPQAGRSQ